MADVTFTTNNDDIASLWRLLNRIVGELYKSASAQLDIINQFDLTRLKNYINRYEKELNFVESVPQLDYPETKGLITALEAPESYVEVDNEYHNRLLAALHRWRVELVNCQSSRQPAGLITHDIKRNRDYLGNVRNLISYIEATQPGDWPGTSPQEPQGGTPLGGI